MGIHLKGVKYQSLFCIILGHHSPCNISYWFLNPSFFRINQNRNIFSLGFGTNHIHPFLHSFICCGFLFSQFFTCMNFRQQIKMSQTRNFKSRKPNELILARSVYGSHYFLSTSVKALFCFLTFN